MASHVVYWQHRRSNGANSHKQACQFCNDAIPAELTDADLIDWLQRLAPFPSSKAGETELSYACLVRRLEGLTGKAYNKFSTKAKLLELIAEEEAKQSLPGKQMASAGKLG